jgi:pilus assembly protein Flp/PilA
MRSSRGVAGRGCSGGKQNWLGATTVARVSVYLHRALPILIVTVCEKRSIGSACPSREGHALTLFNRTIIRVLVAVQSWQPEEGQGMAEYGLILSLVAVVCAAAFTLLHGGISNTINSVTTKL